MVNTGVSISDTGLLPATLACRAAAGGRLTRATTVPKPQRAAMLTPRCSRLEWLKVLVSIVIGSVRCGGCACIRYRLQKPCGAEQVAGFRFRFRSAS